MTTVIRNGTLIDGTGADPVPAASVVIDEGRIVRAGPNIDTPRDADVIDADGRTIMPGMIDSHVHLYGRVTNLQERMLTPPSLQLFYGARNALRTLEAGITSVRDASGSPVGFKLAIERGLIPGPRMRISVSALSQTGGHGDNTMPSGVNTGGRSLLGPEWPHTVVDGPDEVRRAVRELLRAGADFIKLMSTGGVMSPADEPSHTQFTPEEIAVMVYEARAAGKTCMAHAQGTQGIKNAVLAGVESIEHGIWLDDEVMAEMKRRDTFLVPTLVAPIWVLRHSERAPGSVLPQSVRKTKEVMADHQDSFSRAVRAGLRIAMGTDSGVGHHGSNTEELERMVEAGMTPMQAIVASTKTASECIHMQQDVGTIEPGKLADILVVDGDPLADIKLLQDRERLALIMQAGRAHKNTLTTRAPVGA
ncbi:MAG: amidohydrolase family protein [Dehalococcoidia bacterium]